LSAGDVTLAPGGDATGGQIDLGPARRDAVADVFGDLSVTQEGDTLTAEGTVEGTASGTYAFAGTAEGTAAAMPAEARVGVGHPAEHDEALPITPRRDDTTDQGTDEGAQGPPSFTSGFAEAF
jgi:hypothetical protein